MRKTTMATVVSSILLSAAVAQAGGRAFRKRKPTARPAVPNPSAATTPDTSWPGMTEVRR